jgi:hypothetical protein
MAEATQYAAAVVISASWLSLAASYPVSGAPVAKAATATKKSQTQDVTAQVRHESGNSQGGKHEVSYIDFSSSRDVLHLRSSSSS